MNPLVSRSVAVAISLAVVFTLGGCGRQEAAPAAAAATCPGDNGGLTLSPGFCATIFADNIGHVGNDPRAYVIIERYKDQAAMQAHGASEHGKKLIAQLKDLTDGPAQADRLA